MSQQSATAPSLLQHDEALLIDFDGTLVEIAAHPEAITVPAMLPELLAQLEQALGGALALVSGRRFEDLRRHLAPFAPIGAGLHGAELCLEPGADPLRSEAGDTAALATALQARLGDCAGVRIEDKGGAVAVHFRQAPAQQAACEQALGALAPGHGFVVRPGHMLVEARPPGADKGTALRRLMQGPAFVGRRPVFIGDDVTDEDGIAAAEALGGRGIRVGAHGPETAARLPDPAGVRRWLRQSLGALGA
jgi:trehalose 6-phosphate phosphatase